MKCVRDQQMEMEDLHNQIYELQSENLQLVVELEHAHALIVELRASRDQFKAEIERMLLGCKPPPRRKPETALKWKYYHEHKNEIRREHPHMSWTEIKHLTDVEYDQQDAKQDASSSHSQESEGA